MKKLDVIAVDFDGTLCYSNYPELGEPNTILIQNMINLRLAGKKVILWTCREDEALLEAVEWCRRHGLEFDAVNENVPERIEEWGTNPRKIGADIYIDDLSTLPDTFPKLWLCGAYQ